MNNQYKKVLHRYYFNLPPDVPAGYTGVRLQMVNLDPDVGSEVALLLVDWSSFAYSLVDLDPFPLQLKGGLAPTAAGSVLYLLWWFPPMMNGKPFAMYEHILNPSSAGTRDALKQLSDQTHLHVFLYGPSAKLLRVYELANNFDFRRLVDRIEVATEEFPIADFDSAKRLYDKLYDPVTLLKEETEEEDQELVELDTEWDFDPVILVEERAKVESGSIARIVSLLRAMETKTTLSTKRNRVRIGLHGYDDDPREFYEVPEARRWFQNLFHNYPGLWYWIDIESPVFLLIGLCIFHPVTRDGAVTLSSEDMARYLSVGFGGLNEFCSRHGLSPDPTTEKVMRLLGIWDE